MWTILPIVVMVVLLIISFALVFGIALGVGWILTLFLPFSLFEATLLGMIAAMVTWNVWRNIFSPIEPFGSNDYNDYEEEPELEDFDEIPPSRFYKTDADRTWENWFRYMIANTTYDDFLDSGGFAQMNDRQLQELSIRLADAAIAALKAKSPRTKRPRVSKEMLKHEMTKMGQKPYDDDILDTAISAISDELDSLQEELRDVIRGKLWNEPVDVF
ncbi:MAG: hypothetical protein H8E47_00750 [Anaerolineales bacterium]|nr:hypothetical protein [Anaerolineales bacterium]